MSPEATPGQRNIWVLGSSNTDFSYYLEELPNRGRTVQAKRLSVATGGKGANQAVAAAHWCKGVRLIGGVGDDESGKGLVAALESRGVDTSHVSVVEGESSGHAIVLVDENGDNVVIVHGGANRQVPCREPHEFQIEPDDIFVFQLETNLDSIQNHVQIARSKGACVVMNPSPYQVLPKAVLENVDLIVANESEAHQLSGVPILDVGSAHEAGKRILGTLGVESIVITVGAQGAVVVPRSGPAKHFPGIDVQVKDAQGAGDAFLGSLVARLAMGESMERATAFANWVAAQSVTRFGSTQSSLPDQGSIGHVQYDRCSILG